MMQRRPVASSFTSATSHKVVAYPGTAKLKRKRRQRVTPLARRLLLYILGSLVTVWFMRKLILPKPTRPRYRIEPHVAKHVKLYETIVRDKTHRVSADKRQFQYLGPTYGADVSSCDLTVMFMDPRIADPDYDSSGPAWFSLESLAAYVPNDEVCVVLATHYCSMRKHLYTQVAKTAEVTEYAAQEAVRDWIYSKSLPLFRDLIHKGRVRVSFVDYEKYQLKWCDDFGDPTPAFLHVDFWTKEFIRGVDSDVVLVMQDDAVLCQEMDVWSVAKYAFVGAVWPKEATELYPFPEQGMCAAMPGYWRNWLGPQRRWRRLRDPAIKPAELLPDAFPNVCENGDAPVGNGGFSIRQRSWMQTAITTCPHDKYSGMDLQGQALACKVFDQVNEDVYFSVILRALGAPLPSAAEAALFSAEALPLENAMDMYGAPDYTYRQWITPSTKVVRYQGQTVTLPVGLHKPWWYLPSDLLLEMARTCPYLKYIYDPKESRYGAAQLEELRKKKRWGGRIGS